MTDAANDRQHDIFGRDPQRGVALHLDFHGLGTALLQGLGGQHMLDFRGANTEGQRAKRTVGGGMGVATHNGHSRQGQPLLWAHHMHDPLVGVIQIVQGDAKFGAVFGQLLHLNTRHLARGGNIPRLGGDVVIHGGKGFARLAYRTLHRAQAIEGLRRGHFMHQMTVNVQQWRFAFGGVDDMGVIQFLV